MMYRIRTRPKGMKCRHMKEWTEVELEMYVTRPQEMCQNTTKTGTFL